MSSVWLGDWNSRVVNRAQRLGYPNVMSVFKANPGVPFGQVFRLLKETESSEDIPVAYSQVQSVYFDEAEREGALKEAVIDSFVRRFREHFKQGWKLGKKLRERQAQCLSQIELPTLLIGHSNDFILRVWASLIDLDPPDNWCPETVDDPVIQAALARAWTLKSTDDK